MIDRFAQLRMGRLILWPLGSSILVVVMALTPPRSSAGTTAVALFYTVYAALLLGAVLACRRVGITPADVLGPPPREQRPWLTAAVLGPLVLTFSALSLWATIYVAGGIAPDWATAQLENRDAPIAFLDRMNNSQRLLMALNVTLVAPVVEEFVFRGMLLRRWIASRGFWPGVLGSAAIFALFHPPVWIGSFVFGVVAAILYLWSGSLLLPILVHALNNTFVTLAILADQLFPTAAEATPTLAEFRTEWTYSLIMLIVVGGAIVVVTLPLIRQLRARANIS